VVGEQLFLNDVLYDVTSPISVGDAIVVNTNITAANKLSADIKSKIDDLYSKNQTLTSAFANNVNVNGSKNKLYLDLERLISDNTGGTWNNNKYTYRDGEFTVNEDSITFGGTPTNVASIYFMLTNDEIPPEKYVLSGLADCTNIMWGGVNLFKDGVSVQTFNINSKNNTEIDCSSYTYDTVRVEMKRTANNVAMSGTANVMLCLKSDWDLDNTFAPYSKSNHQLTQDSVSWVDAAQIGAMNWCPNDATTQPISDGTTPFTFTVNSDKSVTVSAPSYPVTLASTISLDLHTFTGNEDFVGKTVKASGGVESGIRLVAYRALTADGSAGSVDIESDAQIFNWANNGSGTKAQMKIEMMSGKTLSGPVTFKPMIAPVDYNGPYVPHAMTNRELTEENKIETGSLTGDLTFSSNEIAKKNGIVTINATFQADKDYNAFTEFVNVPSEFRPITNRPIGFLFNDTQSTIISATAFPFGKIQASAGITAGEYYRLVMSYIIA
jgi:hypothetical protein